MLRKTLLASASLATILVACQASAQSSTETFTYDPLGRLIKVEVADGPSDGEVRDYAYDDAGNRTLVTNGTGGSTPAPTPSLSVSNASVSEGGTANFTVSLSAAGSSTITTQYATSSAGSASSNDFSARSGTLTFSAGQTSKTVSVPTIEDSAVESNETFYLDLSNPSGATIADGRGVGTIVNDDNAPAPPSITISNASANEGGSLTFTVSLSASYTSSISVNYATANGTANSSTDYYSRSGTLTFSAGQTSKTIVVPTRNDSILEPNEVFYVNLSGATGGASISDSRGDGTISDDDFFDPCGETGLPCF